MLGGKLIRGHTHDCRRTRHGLYVLLGAFGEFQKHYNFLTVYFFFDQSCLLPPQWVNCIEYEFGFTKRVNEPLAITHCWDVLVLAVDAVVVCLVERFVNNS